MAIPRLKLGLKSGVMGKVHIRINVMCWAMGVVGGVGVQSETISVTHLNFS